MFPNANHVHAFATVFGTMGGFQQQPVWFYNLSKSSLFQILASAILVFQGGGNLDIIYSICVAITFYLFIEITRYISFSKAEDPDLALSEVHEEDDNEGMPDVSI